MISFRVEWQDAPGVTDVVLARTWGRLVVEAGGLLVTEMIDNRSGSVRGGIYGSVFPLCQWIAENWWFLFNESYRFPAPYGSRDLAQTPSDRAWVQRHSLLAAREGGALPDLTIYRDGPSVVGRWTPDPPDAAPSFLRFTGSGEVRVDPVDAERGLAQLVAKVIERLEGFEHPEVNALRDEWSEVSRSMTNERELCEWSARLGLDPYNPDELTDDLTETLRDVVAPLEDSVRTDLLDVDEPQNLRADLEWLNQAHARAADAGRAAHPELALSRIEVKTAHGLGYASATALREHLAPSDGHAPIGDIGDLLLRLGWAESPSRTIKSLPEGPLGAVLERSADGASVVVAPPADDVTGTRFILARAIFLRHFSGSQRDRRLVTDAHTREQRASRAFAAEFLAPAEGLSAHISGRVPARQIDELAVHYDVSPMVVMHQIRNHRLAWLEES